MAKKPTTKKTTKKIIDPAAPDAADLERMEVIHAHLAIPEPDPEVAAKLTLLDKTFMGKPVSRNVKFDDKAAARYLAHYAMTGRKGDSARYAGVHYVTVLRWLEDHEDFGQLCLEAHELWLNTLEREMYRRGVEGVLEPVVAGKDPEIVTYIRKYDSMLLAMLAKKADPTGYGNREASVSVNVNTGVLVAPTQTTPETTYLPIEDVDVV